MWPNVTHVEESKPIIWGPPETCNPWASPNGNKRTSVWTSLWVCLAPHVGTTPCGSLWMSWLSPPILYPYPPWLSSVKVTNAKPHHLCHYFNLGMRFLLRGRDVTPCVTNFPIMVISILILHQILWLINFQSKLKELQLGFNLKCLWESQEIPNFGIPNSCSWVYLSSNLNQDLLVQIVAILEVLIKFHSNSNT
jgi:hypothetical protein